MSLVQISKAMGSSQKKFNIKAMEVRKELSKMCDKEKLLFLSHSNINPKTHLNISKLYLNRNGYKKLGKNFVNFIRNNYN